MNHPVTTVFTIASWKEDPYDEIAHGPKLTRARVEKTFSGDLAGTSTVEYLMMHRPDGTAAFVGFEHVTGVLRGRRGSAVLRHEGTFEAGTAHTQWIVMGGSGTEDWRSLRGAGSFSVGHAPEYAVTLNLVLD